MDRPETNLNIPLSLDAVELLQMYALPHVHRDLPEVRNDVEAMRLRLAFKELCDKGMVREGMGRVISPDVQPGYLCDGTETIEEFKAKLEQHLSDKVGWVATERGMRWIACKAPRADYAKSMAVMRTFVADKDPVVH